MKNDTKKSGRIKVGSMEEGEGGREGGTDGKRRKCVLDHLIPPRSTHAHGLIAFLCAACVPRTFFWSQLGRCRENLFLPPHITAGTFLG